MELEEVIKDCDFSDTFADMNSSTQLLTSANDSIFNDDEVYWYAKGYEAVQIKEKLVKELGKAIEIRELVEEEVVQLKREIEESYDKSQKAKIGGAVAATTGSILGIVGFGLSFVTFGASLPLMVIGGILGGAGGVTAAGADIGYTVVSNERMKKVEEVCQKDEKQMQLVQDLINDLQEGVEELRTHFPQYTVEQLLELIIRGEKDFSNGISIIDGVIDVGRAAVHVSDAARIGTQVAIRYANALALTGHVVGGVAAAMDVIMLPIDIYVMVRASIDVHTYQGGEGESNSDTARRVGDILRDLKEHTKKMKTMYDLVKMTE